MSGKQTMTWNGDADAKLLIAILKASDVKPDFDAVAKELTTDVVTCTPRAVQEHLKKLRKIAQGGIAPTAQTSAGEPSTAATPAKASRKKATANPTGVKKTRKPAAGGKAKKGKDATGGNDDESVRGGDDEKDAPTKKRKRQATVEEPTDAGDGPLDGPKIAKLALAKLDEDVAA